MERTSPEAQKAIYHGREVWSTLRLDGKSRFQDERKMYKDGDEGLYSPSTLIFSTGILHTGLSAVED